MKIGRRTIIIPRLKTRVKSPAELLTFDWYLLEISKVDPPTNPLLAINPFEIFDSVMLTGSSTLAGYSFLLFYSLLFDHLFQS